MRLLRFYDDVIKLLREKFKYLQFPKSQNSDLNQNLFEKKFFNSKLNGRKLGFNTP